MILFNLKCAKDHEFEGWFRNSETYEAQAAAGEIACPLCGAHKVEKALMAPRIGKGGEAAPDPATARAAQMVKQLAELRAKVEENCDYVGPKFAEEARRIHYGETEKRSIYGEASDQEASALGDEGIEVARIPWLRRPNS